MRRCRVGAWEGGDVAVLCLGLRLIASPISRPLILHRQPLQSHIKRKTSRHIPYHPLESKYEVLRTVY